MTEVKDDRVRVHFLDEGGEKPKFKKRTDLPWEISIKREGGVRIGIGIYKIYLSCGWGHNPTRYAISLVLRIDIILFTLRISKKIKSAWN